eukprot:362110-Chlamydomonas_euryale.AAC.8
MYGHCPSSVDEARFLCMPKKRGRMRTHLDRHIAPGVRDNAETSSYAGMSFSLAAVASWCA